MGVSLKYDTEDLDTGKTNVETLKGNLETARDAMKSGLAQVRTDWVSEGGDAFFDSIDNDWEKGVQNCIDVLDDMISALSDARTKYDDIETNAPTYLKF